VPLPIGRRSRAPGRPQFGQWHFKVSLGKDTLTGRRQQNVHENFGPHEVLTEVNRSLVTQASSPSTKVFLSGWPDLNRRPLDPQFCPGHFPSDTGRDHWLPIVPSTRDFTRTDTTADDHQLPPFSGFSGAMVLTAVLTEALSEAVRAHYRSGEIVSRQT
jgi:hypothetical protein